MLDALTIQQENSSVQYQKGIVLYTNVCFLSIMGHPHVENIFTADTVSICVLVSMYD